MAKCMVQRMLAELELSESGGQDVALCNASSERGSGSRSPFQLPPALSTSSTYSSDNERNNDTDSQDTASDRVSDF